MTYILGRIGRFLCFKSTPTDFEFNKLILKKGAWISKNFEKSSTDFEGFVMDFEKAFSQNTLTRNN